MNFPTRIKYMGQGLSVLLQLIGHFLQEIIYPGILITTLFLAFNYLPLWGSLLVTVVIAVLIFAWAYADIKYKEDRLTSEDVICEQYYSIINMWDTFQEEGKDCQTIQNLLTSRFDDFNALLKYHRSQYGEDDTYTSYVGSINKFVKEKQEAERKRLEYQKRKAAEMRARYEN